MIIVSDSSPLIALSLCGALTILDQLFDEIIIPEQVYTEINIEGKPESAAITKWAQGKIMKAGSAHIGKAQNLSLDAGETEAIALYWEKSADLLLIDEQHGRSVATNAGIHVIGTVGLLLEAKKAGLLPAVKPSLDTIRANNIRISDALYQRVLAMAKE
jgi:predicted nucleic acid-binding protein